MKTIKASDLRDSNVLMHYRIVRRWACRNYGIKDADLELLLFLDCQGFFSKKDFKLILTETQNSLIKQYQGLLGTEKVDLKFEEDGIDTIASLSTEINQNVENKGARRLHTVMEKLLEEVSYTASDIGPTEIIINKEYVENSLGELIKSQDLSKFIL